MADRFEMAEALLLDARNRLAGLQETYEQSLHAKTVSAELQIGIKHILENLRSALDYSAREIHSRAVSSGSTGNIYFPIAKRGAKSSDFDSLVGKSIPGIKKARPDLVIVLASFQEFSDPDSAWLPDFATLCNENKHEQLTPQVRNESHELQIQSGGIGLRMSGNARIRMGPGASMRVGGVTILGGQVFGPGCPPKTLGAGDVRDIIWVSFEFSSINQPVLPFLEKAVSGVEAIIAKLKRTI